MKVMRSYWLGLGSGLILSAMLALVISPQMGQGQAVTPQKSSSVSPAKQQENLQEPSPAKQQGNFQQPLPEQSSQNAQTSAQVERPFVIPNGARAVEIADLLLTQGFISNKADFLETVYQKGVESRFRAGTFSLSQGLTLDELIDRLIIEELKSASYFGG